MSKQTTALSSYSVADKIYQKTKHQMKYLAQTNWTHNERPTIWFALIEVVVIKWHNWECDVSSTS